MCETLVGKIKGEIEVGCNKARGTVAWGEVGKRWGEFGSFITGKSVISRGDYGAGAFYHTGLDL
jgi:hypothetical protein